MTDKALVWFRQDLRIHDNPALYHACKSSDNVTAIYILDEKSEDIRLTGGAQKWWLHHSLTSLEKDLEKLGINLIFQQGKAETILKKIVEDHTISALHWNRLYEPYHIARDTKIKDHFSKSIEVKSYNGSLLVEPWAVKNKSGSYFKVFTAYYRHCLSEHKQPEPLPIANKVKSTLKIKSDNLSDWKLLPTKPNWAKTFSDYFTPGEKSARKTLENFLDNKLADYANKRDFTGEQATSGISPYLHFGEISPATIYHTVDLEKHKNTKKTKGADKFISEIYWREFSYHLLYHFPKLQTKNFSPKFDNFVWDKNYKHLEVWQKGQTGYPIVDAGMRELWVSGTMHNRVRMVVASFLIKHLLIHWTKGEEWFWDTLLDADLANNSASWQWVAGSGADAAPYFRIFNPVTQGEKFDTDGKYVRKWLPQLSNLPDKYLHSPWKAPKDILEKAGVTLGKNYPKPIVDHATAREKALYAYSETRK